MNSLWWYSAPLGVSSLRIFSLDGDEVSGTLQSPMMGSIPFTGTRVGQ